MGFYLILVSKHISQSLVVACQGMCPKGETTFLNTLHREEHCMVCDKDGMPKDIKAIGLN